MCVSPINLKNDNPRIHEDYLTRKVPCGRCFECLTAKQGEWRFRLLQEMKDAEDAHFITYTYEDNWLVLNENYIPVLNYEDLQKFHKRFRTNYKRKYGKTSNYKYFAVGEYGERTGRPHYHAIAFNVIDIDLFIDSWQCGNIHIGDVNENSITYTLKYILKKLNKEDAKMLLKQGIIPERAMMSKNLGAGFLTKEMIKYFKDDPTRNAKYFGKNVTLPRYYRDKIFTDIEKRKRFINIEQKLLKHEERREKSTFKSYVINRNRKMSDAVSRTD